MPPPRSTAVDPARQRHVLGHESGEVVGVAGGQPRGPERSELGRQAVARRARHGRAHRPARGRRGRRRPGRRRSRGSGSSPAGKQGRRLAVADDDPVGRPGRQQQDAVPEPGPRTRRAAAASSAPPVEIPTIGRPSPCARPLAVAIPTRSPVNAPGPVPTTIPAICERAMPSLLEQPVDRRQERLAVAVAGRPARHDRGLAVGRPDREDDPGRGRVDGQHDIAAGVVPGCRRDPAAALIRAPPGIADGAHRARSARSRAARRRSRR